jgi:protein-S-isoprenylcysteine O-methyltransferase Ste14
MRVNMRLLVAQIAIMAVVFALFLFLAAGTVAWPAGWVFWGLFFGFVVAITAWLYRHNPGLLVERMTGLGAAGEKAWDRVVMSLISIVFLAWLILMPWDAVRFHWSRVPVWLQGVGAIILVCSFYLFFLTFRENSYLSPAMRVQTERGQEVISTGPYRHVRHPMYSAFLLFVVGTALLLGAWYGLGFGLLIVGGTAARAVLEEGMLRSELPGYAAYMARVKYRLIPHIW